MTITEFLLPAFNDGGEWEDDDVFSVEDKLTYVIVPEDFPEEFTFPDVDHVVRPSEWDLFKEHIITPIIETGLAPNVEAESAFKEAQMDGAQ